MDSQTVISSLNDQQKEAVSTNSTYTLVLAGAGSGKTRVLVHRVAWLIAIDKVPLQNIFVVTFTNKAATEMRKRIEDILNYPTKSFWIGTFHGLAHKFLRIHWEEAGLDKNFQIMDSLDQIRMIKKMLKALNKSGSGNYAGLCGALEATKKLKPDIVSMSLGGTQASPEMHKLVQ